MRLLPSRRHRQNQKSLREQRRGGAQRLASNVARGCRFPLCLPNCGLRLLEWVCANIGATSPGACCAPLNSDRIALGSPVAVAPIMLRCIHFISIISLPHYRFRVLHGSKGQDHSDEVDNVNRIGKRYAIADDQEILQEGTGLHFALLRWTCCQSQPFKAQIKYWKKMQYSYGNSNL